MKKMLFNPEYTLNITTYNIHKGMSALNQKVITTEILQALITQSSDIICLQEVQGRNDTRADKFHNFSKKPQHQLFADEMGYYYSYGKNATYKHGHHGNSIVSRYPINTIHNLDISVNPIEKRGMLHSEVIINNIPIAVMSVHLNLLERDRNKQYKHIVDYVNTHIDSNQPLIIAGDFNDWRQKSNQKLGEKLTMHEVTHQIHDKFEPTFPANFPLLSLDRIYVRNIHILNTQILSDKPWSKLSDHLPVTTQLLLKI